MSQKNRDTNGRWRSTTIAFRVSPEENARINEAVSLSGLTKQEYITNKLLNHDVVVVKSSRTFKALRDKMEQIIEELQRICSVGECTKEFLETINYVSTIYTDYKEEKS